MNVGELKKALKDVPDDYSISLINYFEHGKGKKKKHEKEYGEIEFVEDIVKKSKYVSIRIKPEDSYC